MDKVWVLFDYIQGKIIRVAKTELECSELEDEPQDFIDEDPVEEHPVLYPSDYGALEQVSDDDEFWDFEL